MSKKIKPIKIFPTKEETEKKENTNDSKEQQEDEESKPRVQE